MNCASNYPDEQLFTLKLRLFFIPKPHEHKKRNSYLDFQKCCSHFSELGYSAPLKIRPYVCILKRKRLLPTFTNNFWRNFGSNFKACLKPTPKTSIRSVIFKTGSLSNWAIFPPLLDSYSAKQMATIINLYWKMYFYVYLCSEVFHSFFSFFEAAFFVVFTWFATYCMGIGFSKWDEKHNFWVCINRRKAT